VTWLLLNLGGVPLPVAVAVVPTGWSKWLGGQGSCCLPASAALGVLRAVLLLCAPCRASDMESVLVPMCYAQWKEFACWPLACCTAGPLTLLLPQRWRGHSSKLHCDQFRSCEACKSGAGRPLRAAGKKRMRSTLPSQHLASAAEASLYSLPPGPS
jgi:hypothetical protein